MPRGRVKRVAPRDDQHVALPIPDSDEWLESGERTEPPEDWVKGELLNFENMGDSGCYLTKYPERLDLSRPHRYIRFRSVHECQDFVSHWYALHYQDPRAR